MGDEMQDTSNDVIVIEENDAGLVVAIGRDRYKISHTADKSWDPVLDRTWMDTRQMSAWLKMQNLKTK